MVKKQNYFLLGNIFTGRKVINKRVYKKDIYDFDIIEIDSKYDRLSEKYIIEKNIY